MMANVIPRRHCPTSRFLAFVGPIAVGCVFLVARAADAALTHQWLFNDGTANDSVGMLTARLTATPSSLPGSCLFLTPQPAEMRLSTSTRPRSASTPIPPSRWRCGPLRHPR